MKTKSFICFGLNPAYQCTLKFKHFQFGEVNRAEEAINFVGGKGQNYTVACEQLQKADKITLVQFTGGSTGEYIKNFFDSQNIHHVSIETQGKTRNCTTLLDKNTGVMTELIEPSAEITAEEKKNFETAVLDMFNDPQNKIELISLCGSLPKGLDGSTYEFIVKNRPSGTFVFLDVAKNVDCLKTGNVDALKINFEEAYGLCPKDLIQNKKDIHEIGKVLMSLYPVKVVAVTDGPNKAYMFVRQERNTDTPYQTYQYTIPNIFDYLEEEEGSNNDSKSGNNNLRINPLGAGDTCSGVFTMKYIELKDFVEAYRYGLAAASASCLFTNSIAHFQRNKMEALYQADRKSVV